MKIIIGLVLILLLVGCTGFQDVDIVGARVDEWKNVKKYAECVAIMSQDNLTSSGETCIVWY